MQFLFLQSPFYTAVHLRSSSFFKFFFYFLGNSMLRHSHEEEVFILGSQRSQNSDRMFSARVTAS